MRKPVILVGAGGHARALIGVLQEPLNKRKYELMCVVDIAKTETSHEKILGYDVKCGISHIDYFPPKNFCLFLGVGDNKIRKSLYQNFSNAGYVLPTLVSGVAYVSEFANLGLGNFIAPFAHIGPEAVLKENIIVNTFANVEHQVRIASDSHIAPGAVLLGKAQIGRQCFVGSNSVVLPDVVIGDLITIGAGSVVTKSFYEAGKIICGVPARDATL